MKRCTSGIYPQGVSFLRLLPPILSFFVLRPPFTVLLHPIPFFLRLLFLPYSSFSSNTLPPISSSSSSRHSRSDDDDDDNDVA